MVLGGFLGVVSSMDVVTVCQVRVVGGQFMIAVFVMFCGFAVMTCSVLVMFRCLLVMVRCFMRHGEFLSSCRHPCGTRGLSAPHWTAWVTVPRMEYEKKTVSVENVRTPGGYINLRRIRSSA